jgi:putative tricarboxylic transport membrane protein
MTDLLSATGMLLEPFTLLAGVLGAVIGIAIGVIPGLGPGIAIALALPLTINMELAPSVALLMSLYCTSIYGGCVPSILLNVPGTPASAATAIDGFKMSQQGKAGLALTLATIGSAAGGLMSVAILMLAAPVLANFALRFGPLELFLVGMFALTCVVLLDRRRFVRGVVSALIGITIASIGQDPVSGTMRMTFGHFPLAGGIQLVPLLIGLFAISEVIIRIARPRAAVAPVVHRPGIDLPDRAWWRRGVPLILKSSAIGTTLGVLPGAGPTAASFVSYAEAKRSATEPESFGQGNVAGVVASETANNSVTGGAMVPALSLGIPGDAITALILAGLVMQGIVPGPRLYIDHNDVVLFILMTLLLANIGVIVIGLAGLRIWTRVLQLPEPLIVTGVVVLATIGTFSTNNSTLDLTIMVAAGVLGAVLQIARVPMTPLILGFVLAPMIEQNLRQALVVYQGDWGVFVEREIAGILVLMILAVMLWPLAARLAARRGAHRDAPDPDGRKS